MQKTRKKQQGDIDEKARRLKFNLAILFGPIFICSCCSRRLFENGVTKITPDLKIKVNQKKENLFFHCVRKEIQVDIELNGKFDKSGSYTCSTCKTAMLRGKVPAMATINDLYLPPINEQFHLTELENNMIALIINFQYIYCLKKSRWAATKKQMISVPVAPDTVNSTLQQLPRMPCQQG